MDTQQVALQVKMSPVFLKKLRKLKQGDPYVNTLEALKPLQIYSPRPCDQRFTHRTPCSCILCTTDLVFQVLLVQVLVLEHCIQNKPDISRGTRNKARKENSEA